MGGPEDDVRATARIPVTERMWAGSIAFSMMCAYLHLICSPGGCRLHSSVAWFNTRELNAAPLYSRLSNYLPCYRRKYTHSNIQTAIASCGRPESLIDIFLAKSRGPSETDAVVHEFCRSMLLTRCCRVSEETKLVLTLYKDINIERNDLFAICR